MHALIAGSAASAEPIAPVSARWMRLYSLAAFGFAAINWGASSVLTPELVSRVDEANKVAVFGVITAMWGAVSLVCAPVFGALSDRTVSSRGRRHPWILAGTLGTAVTLAAMSVQTELAGVLVLAPFAAVFPLMASTGLTAVVPDEVPVCQRATVSAWGGVAGLTGMLAGTVLVSTVLTGLAEGYLAGAAVLVALTAPFALLTRGVPLRPEERPRKLFGSLRVDPRAHPDFAWALGAHFCHQLGNGLATVFLYFFLEDVVRCSDPARGLLTLTVIYVAVASAVGVLTGRISDRSRCRKKITAASTVCQCLASAVLAVSHTMSAVIVAAVLLGVGFGMYSAAGRALLTELLPDASARARDLGVVAVAGSAAGLLASAVAALVINHLGGYPVLYWTAAALAAASGVLVWQIRNVH